MKRTLYQITFAVLICITLLVFASCSSGIEHIGVSAKTISFSNLSEMEEYAELIVRGVRLEGEESIITTANGLVASSYSFSQFQITEIHKDASGSLASGDIITILENEAFDATQNVVYHIAGYNMMVEGKEYLLFLTAHTTNGTSYYVSAGVNFGTISLEDDGRNVSAKTRSGDSISDFSSFQSIWQEAKEKYAN